MITNKMNKKKTLFLVAMLLIGGIILFSAPTHTNACYFFLGCDGDTPTGGGLGGTLNRIPTITPCTVSSQGNCPNEVQPVFMDRQDCWVHVTGNRFCPIHCQEEVNLELPVASDVRPAWDLDVNVKAGQTFFWGIGDVGTDEVVDVIVDMRCRHEDYFFAEWQGELTAAYNHQVWLRNEYRRILAIWRQAHADMRQLMSDNQHCFDGSSSTSGCDWNWLTTEISRLSGIMQSAKGRIDDVSGRPTEGSLGDLCRQMREQNRLQLQLITLIQACPNRILTYEYEVELSLEFQEPVNATYPNSRHIGGSKNLELISAPGVQAQPVGRCDPTQVFIMICGSEGQEDGCEIETRTVQNCEFPNAFGTNGRIWELNETFKHRLSADNSFVWWSLKSNGRLLSGNEKENDPLVNTLPEPLFYFIGYGFPTALSLQDGIYSMRIRGEGFGNEGRFTHHEGLTLNWECEYQVDNDIFGYECEYDFDTEELTDGSPDYCKPRLRAVDSSGRTYGSMLGLDVVYRVVSLTNVPANINDDSAVQNSVDIVFPGREATGRRRGQNWTDVRNVTDIDVINIMRNTVRTEDPMFEIMLTVEVMQGIRRNNQNVDGDPYVPWSGAGRMVCHNRLNNLGEANKVGYTYCASEFLTQLATINEFSSTDTGLLRGTCMTNASGTELNHQQRSVRGVCSGNFRNFNGDWSR